MLNRRLFLSAVFAPLLPDTELRARAKRVAAMEPEYYGIDWIAYTTARYGAKPKPTWPGTCPKYGVVFQVKASDRA